MNKITNRTIILDILSKMIPAAVAFLIPLFFLPSTVEFFSFNKLALVTIATLLLIIVWAVKMLVGDKTGFTKSLMDTPLFLFTAVMTLSTIFSVSKTDSVFGIQGRWVGLFSFLIMLAYFYVSTPLLKDIKTIKMVLYSFVASSTIASLVAILSYYKVFLGNASYIKIQNFTLAGSSVDTLVISAIAFVLGFCLLTQEKNLIGKILLGLSVVLNFYLVSILRLNVGWAILIAGLLAFVRYIDIKKVIENKLVYIPVTATILLITLLTLLPATRSVLIDSNYPQELTLSIKDSWLVASSIVQNYPFLATGPGTFYLNFTRYKPLSLNTTDLWNIRFDMPNNESFNVLSTLGIVGLLAMIFLSARILKLIDSSRKMDEEDNMSKIVSVAAFAVVTSFLFTPATILTSFTFFFIVGVLISANAVSNKFPKVSESIFVEAEQLSSVAGITEASVIKKEYFKYIVSVPIFALVGYVGYISYTNYAAEYYMRQSLVAAAKNDGTATYELQRKSITLNPRRDVYHNTYAQTNLAIANSLAGKADLTDGEKQTIQTLIAQAIRSTRISTEVLGPINATNWEIRAAIYRSIINVAQNASDWAVGSYNTAIQLDPANPRLRVDLGGVYFAAGDYLSAANQFRQATGLKPDYANAYYNFAQALLGLKDIQSAITALETTKLLVKEGTQDYQIVSEEIKALQSQLPSVAGASTNKPTVEQLAGQDKKSQTQEPLSNPTQKQPVSNENLDLGSLPTPEKKPTVTPTPTPTTENKKN